MFGVALHKLVGADESPCHRDVSNVMKSYCVFFPHRDVTVTEGGCMTYCVTALGPKCVVCFGAAEGLRGLYY